MLIFQKKWTTAATLLMYFIVRWGVIKKLNKTKTKSIKYDQGLNGDI